MKRKRPNFKRGGWKESSLKLTPAAKKRRAEYLRGWSVRLGQLLLAETERR